VLVDRFRPTRSQRRARQCNDNEVRLKIGRPLVTAEKLELYDRYHAFQSDARDWPEHAPKDAGDYAQSFVENPFPTEEWCYYIGQRLIGVGYVDVLPGGLSAIYFFYDPDERKRSLGTWNVLRIIDMASSRNLPHVYLGYFVEGCRSLQYKANFAPNQIRLPDGTWSDFRT
jgi:arginine-tRNA-protein transferase